MADIFVSL